jgi:O-glycosyl hydrolase
MPKLNLICMLGFCVAMLLAACAAPPTPAPPTAAVPTATPVPTSTPTPVPTPSLSPSPTTALQVAPLAVVTVDPATVLQTVREVGGGNFIHRFPRVTVPLDPVGALNLETLQMDVVRVRMDLDQWEPVNDDDDPATFQWEAFEEGAYNRATFGLMQDLAARGVTLIASAWAVPDWLVENPEAERQQRIREGLVPEAIEMIAAWLLVARDTYGVQVAYVSFNEADYGVNVKLTAEEYGALIAQAGPRFAELGLETQWLLADATSLGACQVYARDIWARRDARPYLGPLACHSWDGLSVPDQTLERLAAHAQALERELWITEGGWDFRLWQRPEEFPTWENALNLATAYSRALKSGSATTLLYWQMSGNDYSTNDGTRPYPSLEMLAQYARHFPPGSRIVGTSRDLFTLYSVAVQAREGLTLHLINTQVRVQPVRIEGLPAGGYRHVVSDESGTLREVGRFEVEGAVEVSLPPQSVSVVGMRE